MMQDCARPCAAHPQQTRSRLWPGTGRFSIGVWQCHSLPGFGLVCANKLKLSLAYLEALRLQAEESPCFNPASWRWSCEEGMVVGRITTQFPTSSGRLYLNGGRLGRGGSGCACSPQPLNSSSGAGCRHADRFAANHRSMRPGWMWPPRLDWLVLFPASPRTMPFTLNQDGRRCAASRSSFDWFERPWESAQHLRLRLRLRILAPPPDHWTPSPPPVDE